ncbi:GrpB family protein [Sphingomonas koreensis]|nr:GrpB family protein [Sphingomonas koreensis]
MPVTLVPHDPSWSRQAELEIGRLQRLPGVRRIIFHHIGSTAVPGILAKPTLDLLGVAAGLGDLDSARAAMELAGYEWHGEFGFVGRRYLTLTDHRTGIRAVNLHCYASGDPAITRHLAFRDYLRADPELATGYECIKRHCAKLYPGDSHAYTTCKDEWIKRVEADALIYHDDA